MSFPALLLPLSPIQHTDKERLIAEARKLSGKLSKLPHVQPLYDYLSEHKNLGTVPGKLLHKAFPEYKGKQLPETVSLNELASELQKVVLKYKHVPRQPTTGSHGGMCEEEMPRFETEYPLLGAVASFAEWLYESRTAALFVGFLVLSSPVVDPWLVLLFYFVAT